ncbi:DUF1329 domain-containing protein [Sinimarinibacterium sp. CAU 1509]|uniref:DUF1329 domain-containing protein n=1 Tax=Sinimarinibacterium sp. CAU 1509 TaxID=2562283 RepID=UPI00200A0BAB|nr:DUF1329 domain-containing protein [Sinimarinibacterium sp. CAU 1509]
MIQKRHWWIPLIAAAALGSTSGAFAKASADEAARLGKDLTPVGATRAGNADGSIPEWIGGKYFDDTIRKQTPASLEALRQQFEDVRTKSPQDFDALLKYLDNFKIEDYPAISKQIDAIIAKLPADQQALAKKQREQIGGGGKYEAPQFIITKDTMAKYAEHLTEGQKAMFAKYPDYRMIVYPSLRTAYFPTEVEQATIKNATTASLKGTDEVEGAVLGFPFPIPKSGAEVLWNHKMRFRGSAVRRYNNQAIVKLDGSYKISKLVEDVKFKYANLQEANPGTKILLYYLSEVLSPPRVAGQLILVHETSGAEGSGRDAWIYNPGLGRVNRAPDVGYDNPYIGTDGEQFNDQVDLFNGALDRYDWKLVGKKDMYIPYNSFLINAPLIKYKDIIRPGHINQNLARYEMHRVWIVEATLRQGLRHQFKKRRFYVDEDSWAIAAVDCYDNRDQLWKVQEGQLITVPFVPTVTAIPEIIYDLQSGRYFVTALQNEDKISDFKIDFNDRDFAPNGLARKAQSK